MATKRIGGIDKAGVLSQIHDLGNTSVKVGWFQSSKYPKGTPVAYVAAIQEFGYPEGGIPARPTFRPTIAAKSAEWKSLVKSGVIALTDGKATADKIANALGQTVAGDVRKAIAELTAPPLKETTLAARRHRGNGSTKPLVDTRVLLPTLTAKIEKGGAE